MKKKLSTILALLLCFVLLLSGCAGKEEKEAAEEGALKKNVGIVYSTSGLGDMNINDSCESGIM